MTSETVTRRPSVDLARVRAWLPRYGVYLAILLLVLYNIFFTPYFLTWSNVRIQLIQVAPVVIVALGMALVIGTEGIDLSVGSVMALAAAFIPLYLGYGVVAAIVVSLIAGVLVGLINGVLVARVGLQPIVATLALFVGGRGLAVVITKGQLKDIHDPSLISLGSGDLLRIPVLVWIAAALVLVVAFVVRRTVFGRRLLAIGGNRPASELAGLPVKRVLITVYVFCSVLASIAGLLSVARIQSSDASSVGLLIELSAITAVVVGGTPLTGGKVRVVGTVAGALLMQLVIATMIKHNLQPSTTEMVQAVIILIAVYVAREEDPVTMGIVSDPKSPAATVAEDVRRAERTDRIVGTVQRQGALAVFVVVVLVSLVAFPNFRSTDNAATILVAAAPPMLIALGMTFVIITGGIDLSVGSLYVLGGVVAAWASSYGWVAAFVAPLLVCGAIGLIDGLLIAYTRMAPFIVTLAAQLGAVGLMRAISSEGSRTYLVKSRPFAHFGSGSLLGLGYPVWLAAVLVVIGMVLLSRTRFGHAVYAVGGSEDAAALMGIAVRRTKVGVYVMSGLLAGLAGAINAAKLGSGVTVLGSGMELDAIAAVVIGGTLLTGGAGTIGGTVAGVLLLGVIQNLINQVGNINSNWQQVISGAFLALVVVAQTYLVKLRRVT